MSRVDAVASVGAEAAAAYELLNDSARELTARVDELCTDPDVADPAAGGAVAAAIAEARAAWTYLSPMQTVGVKDRRSWAVLDWPAAAEDIAELLADKAKDLTAERIGNRVGADQRGLGAAEHLLAWHLGTSEPPTASTAQRRCDYLAAVAEVVETESELILADIRTVEAAGGGLHLLFGADAEAGIDHLVNEAIFVLESMTDLELGRALGEDGTQARPGAIIEGPLGLGVADLRAGLAGVEGVMLGAGVADVDGAGSGLQLVLPEELVSRLRTQIDAAQSAISGIDGSLRDAVRNDPASVSAARAALKTVQITIATEVVAHLGVVIGFSDADGDTSS